MKLKKLVTKKNRPTDDFCSTVTRYVNISFSTYSFGKHGTNYIAIDFDEFSKFHLTKSGSRKAPPSFDKAPLFAKSADSLALIQPNHIHPYTMRQT